MQRWVKIVVVGILAMLVVIIAGLSLIGFSPVRSWAFLSAPRLGELAAQQAGKNLTHVYPAIIKGNWEPSTFHLDQILAFEIDNLKAMEVKDRPAEVVPTQFFQGL